MRLLRPGPDRFWAHHGAHLLADAVHAWAASLDSHVLDRSSTPGQLRAAGQYLALTPDEAIARCRPGEIRLVTSHPLCGGLPEEPSRQSLRPLRETVMPAVQPAPPPRAKEAPGTRGV